MFLLNSAKSSQCKLLLLNISIYLALGGWGSLRDRLDVKWCKLLEWSKCFHFLIIVIVCLSTSFFPHCSHQTSTERIKIFHSFKKGEICVLCDFSNSILCIFHFNTIVAFVWSFHLPLKRKKSWLIWFKSVNFSHFTQFYSFFFFEFSAALLAFLHNSMSSRVHWALTLWKSHRHIQRTTGNLKTSIERFWFGQWNVSGKSERQRRTP